MARNNGKGGMQSETTKGYICPVCGKPFSVLEDGMYKHFTQKNTYVIICSLELKWVRKRVKREGRG